MTSRPHRHASRTKEARMAAAPIATTVGTRVPRVEGPARVTGAARFTADVALHNALWAKVVRSPHPHARIRSIDTSAAMQVPGVRAIVTARDLPDPKKRLGRARLRDLPILCDDVVRFIGDRVAVVAAETAEAAEEAALLVRVDYEELPAVFDPVVAMEPRAPVLHPDLPTYEGYNPDIHADRVNVAGYQRIEHGDVQTGFARADLVVEHTYRTQLAHHGYLEPNAFALRIEEDGRVRVWASNKNPFNLKSELARALDLPSQQVIVETPSIGADFGGKAGQPDPEALYYLARMTGRPVREVLTTAEDLTATSPRHPAHIWLRTGVTRDGTVVAHQGRIIFDSGAYAAYKPSVRSMPGEGVESLAGCYDIPNLHLEGFSVYTNHVPCGYMRAPGQPQAYFALETHMTLIARELGVDPYAFRARNVIRLPVQRLDVVAPTVLQEAASAIDWAAPKPPRVGRGIAMAARRTGAGEGSSDVTVNPDGTITVISALPDNGPGGLTTVVQVVAEFFGVPINRLRLVHGNTDALPVDAASAGSRVTNVATRCVTSAGQQVIDQLTPLAATMLGSAGATWERPGWQAPDGRFVSLEEVAAEMITPGDPRAHAQVTLNVPGEGGPGYCAQAAEVEVDTETGRVTLRKIATAQDVGTVLNALSHQGQVDGSVVQGIGYALMEEITVDEGRPTVTHLGEYKLPVVADVPELVTVNIPSSGVGPFNVRSVGEIVIVPVAAAIAGAVIDAVGAPIFQLPVTAESVLAAIERVREDQR
ncbi:MAG: molybdopterin-dependent oxidoreductase [Chloroflexi bacterium]|nr:molybdopterin-dependent oxidoreductase [Chloroflexota bacterium]